MARLLIVTPEGQHERELVASNSVGRQPGNVIQLLDRIVSKEHCVVEQRGPRYVLRDLASLNGTYVNGQRIQGEHVLNDGDEIALGNTRMFFREGAAAPPPAAPPSTFQAFPPPPAVRAAAVAGGFGTPSPQAPPVESAGAAPWIGARGPVPGAVEAPTAPPVAEPAPPAPPRREPSRVTMSVGNLESHVRAKILAEIPQFLPERLITDADALRRDYERLRISHELARAIGAEIDLDRVLDKILERAFDLLASDRGVILLYDDEGELKPRAVRSRRATGEENFVVSSSIVRQVEREKVAITSSDAMLDPRFSGSHSIIMQGIRSSMAVPLLHKSELLGIMVLDSLISTNAFGEKDLLLFTNVANQAALFIQNARMAKQAEHDALSRERFQRLLSPQVAQLVMEGRVEVKQGGDPRETTMLFSDIRGFTSMSEGMDAQDIVSMLNDYFERMVEIVFRHEGTLDKFVGDEIMALFGAPMSHEDDAVRAVSAALEMLADLRAFNEQRKEQGRHGFEIGIGINTGKVVAGYLGSSKAMQYTVIGAPVNLAARLCSQARGMQVIISEATWSLVRDHFDVNELDPVKPKGIAQPVRIFEVLGRRTPSMRPEPTRPSRQD